MAALNHAVLLAVTAAAGVTLFLNHRAIREALEHFNNNFPRGGPPAAMHPSPAGDDSHLRPNSRQRATQK